MTKRSRADQIADARGRAATAPDRARRERKIEEERVANPVRIPSTRGPSKPAMRLAAVGAMVAGLLGGLAGPALAAEPISPTGTGPSTTVAGRYQLLDEAGAVREDDYADPAADATFPLPSGLRVVVFGLGSWCVQPDTRAVHYAADDHEATCTSPAPDGVPTSWARPAVAR